MTTRTTSAGGTIVDGRTCCGVVHCPRSAKGEWSWWFCQDHRRIIPMWAKARKRRIMRAMRRRGWIESNQRSWWCTNERGERLSDSMGRFLIRVANARATGL